MLIESICKIDYRFGFDFENIKFSKSNRFISLDIIDSISGG